MRKVLSLDLRERIVAAYDQEQVSREVIAQRFRVSLGMVKKLLQQRRQTGDLRPRYHNCGAPRRFTPESERQMRGLLAQKPDLTLRELREVLGVDCTLATIHNTLVRMGLTYKKRRSGPASRTAPTSPRPGAAGGGGRAASTRPG